MVRREAQICAVDMQFSAGLIFIQLRLEEIEMNCKLSLLLFLVLRHICPVCAQDAASV